MGRHGHVITHTKMATVGATYAKAIYWGMFALNMVKDVHI